MGLEASAHLQLFSVGFSLTRFLSDWKCQRDVIVQSEGLCLFNIKVNLWLSCNNENQLS